MGIPGCSCGLLMTWSTATLLDLADRLYELNRQVRGSR